MSYSNTAALIEAFGALAEQVAHALRAQLGDPHRIAQNSDEVLRFRIAFTNSDVSNTILTHRFF